MVTPTSGEFIEIHNPTALPIDLSDVYLTDATFSGGGTYYYNIVTGSNAGGGGFADFHARFPDGASIAPGAYQTISLPGSDAFLAEYGIGPDYELFEDGGAPDAVPDMREALPGSINNQGGLSNSGEVVILFTWDGASDLVADIDYAVWGDKVEAVDKTGVTIDGPDPDSTGSTYLSDTAIASQDIVAPGSHAGGASFQRADLAEGTETQTGGNGLTGSDETSEDLSVTWSIDTVPTPGGAFVPPTVWIINEIHADPAPGISGDANADGVRHFSDDEFVEIVNISGAAVDISGWTLADGFSVRHTFPAGTMIEDQCGVVVFGGGSPTGSFGGVVVQIASSSALGLNNGGDTVTLNDGSTDVTVATYGSEGGDNQSLTLDPDLTGAPWTKHSVATGSGGSLFSPGALIDGSQFGGCPVVVVELREIYEIQGDGLASPFVGQTVKTEDNSVTTLAPNGFFMQTPTDRSDGDVDTSDGIFVFTASAPTVSVGDRVDVTGVVAEFFGMTEITNSPAVTVVVTGSVPSPVPFDAFVPSPDPVLPSCAIEYECYEGMLVEVVAGTVAASNQEFGSDPFAEIHVVARSGRAFREPGIEFPGLFGLPVWDGNPEVFELDPDKLGLPNQNIPAGSTFSATGVIGFEFNHYELWPSELTVDLAVLPVSVRPAGPNELTVGSLNLFRLFDGDTLASSKLSSYIHDVLRSPDILAVQEVESLSVLDDLAAEIFAVTSGAVDYTAYLEEGNDIGGIDVGILVRQGITVTQVTQLGADELFEFDDPPSRLHDRPPLLLEAICDDTFPIKVMVLHMRSLGGIETERTQQKRFEQAESVAQKVQDIQSADPNVHLVVIGDFNAFEFTDGYVDLAGIIKGDFTPSDSLVCDFNSCSDLVDPDLTDEVLLIPAAERYSFIFRDKFNPAGSRGDAQILDHAMTSDGLGDLVQGFEYGRGNADAVEGLLEDDGTLAPLSLRSSDHDGLVLYLFKDEDHDGVPDADDVCLGTVIPEGVPTQRLGTNRWALVDEDGIFDTNPPNGQGNGLDRSFTIEDTAGCSCEQIIDELHLGKGHEKYGCSTGVMETWIDKVQE